MNPTQNINGMSSTLFGRDTGGANVIVDTGVAVAMPDLEHYALSFLQPFTTSANE